MGRLRDKVVVVTGASSGIGRATALRFAQRGATVVLAARREAPLQAVAEQCRRAGGEALAVPTDVTDLEAMQALARTAPGPPPAGRGGSHRMSVLVAHPQPARAASRPAGPRLVSRWTLVAGARMHALLPEEPPPPDAPTVVLVHGLVMASRHLVPTARLLSHSCRVLMPDLPGFGRSDKPERTLTLPELADALEAWMRAEALEHAVLVGSSLGCQLLTHLAVRHPARVRALVLQGPTMEPTARGALRQMVRWVHRAPHAPLTQGLSLLKDYAQAGPFRALATFRAALADRIEERLPRIHVPVLLVRGGRDPLVPQAWAEQLVRLLPHGRLVVIPGGSHSLAASAPLELCRVMQPFLHGVEAPAHAAPAPGTWQEGGWEPAPEDGAPQEGGLP